MQTEIKKSRSTMLSRTTTILFAAFVVTSGVCWGQILKSDSIELPQFPNAQSPLPPVQPETIDVPYRPITRSERLYWFVTGTSGLSHAAGVALVSAGGTAINRPGEYGTNWRGFADRVGVSMAGSAAGNAIEGGVGLGLREDPRYFPAEHEAFAFRVGHVVRLTFLARGRNGTFEPAYGRYSGIVGGNFLSNTWRVHSEASAKDALLRSSESFGGRMAANAFAEFWPEVRRHVLSKRNRAAQWDAKLGGKPPLIKPQQD
jgi:hypothetical protein